MIDTPGAVAAEGPDAPVAAHYGDPMAEQRAMATGVVMVDHTHRGVLAIPGVDRLTWLHSITTQHLTALKGGTETLVLSPHGHVEHHAVVADDGETTLLDVEPGTAPALLDFLERMRFLMRVEPRDATAEYAILTLVGPELPVALAALGVRELGPVEQQPVPGPKFASSEVAAVPTAAYPLMGLDGGGFVRRMPDLDGLPHADLLLPRPQVAATVERLRAAGVRPCGLWGYAAQRAAARRPRLGVDTDHRTLPAEVGWLATAVHLDKGCYRGQETVARVHNLGRPPRRLVLLHLDGEFEEPPAPGTPVQLDDRAVGFVGTGARHHELGPIVLAVVKRNVADDAKLWVAGSAAAID